MSPSRTSSRSDRNSHGFPATTKAAERAPTLTTRAHDFIRSGIISGRLGPQVPLVEAEIAGQLEMSKTPVREALLRLARAGLVEINEFRGARVKSFTPADALEIFQLRATLEPMALRLSYEHMRDEDFRNLESILERAAVADRDRDWFSLASLNREFHAGLYLRCPNQRVLGILDEVRDAVQLISIRGWLSSPTQNDEQVEHEEILQTLYRDRDLDAGCERLSRHVLRFIATHEPEG